MKFILSFLALYCSALIIAQEHRIALVIGNSGYEHGWALKNPVNDANLMDSTLSSLGFKVIKLTNASKQEMDYAILNFWRGLKDTDVALFYYAGHGMQVNGINYLLPVDAVIEDQLALEIEAIDVEKIINQFDVYPDNINIVILDACRDNPFKSWMRSGNLGFSPMEAPSGTIIAFATAPGATASDGFGNNGLFTEKLAEQITKPQRIEDVFINTRIEVRKTSNGLQNPQEWSQLNGQFMFTDVIFDHDPPRIELISPYASENDTIYLDTPGRGFDVEGIIYDESNIKSIVFEEEVGSFISYSPSDINPTFSAKIIPDGRDEFKIIAIDEAGNSNEKVFYLNWDAASYDNPMGKTWAVFIENSEYGNFKNLETPFQDITIMKAALEQYQVHNFIIKKNMTKEEMENFFALDLRQLLRSNRVVSILIWYAGHGISINEIGYLIPVDATFSDKSTYFNINMLPAVMQSYTESLSHTLLVTDACDFDPSFYQSTVSKPKIRSCDDWQVAVYKSFQSFSSRSYTENNSQFTSTFANSLADNPDSCIPIENIVHKVTVAVEANNQQKPSFGKIAGFEYEESTFLFLKKDN